MAQKSTHHISIAIILTLVGIFVVAVGLAYAYLQRNQSPEPADEPTVIITTASPSPTPLTIISPSPEPSPVSTSLPETVTLNVPFLVQAPFANWDELHGEACEEASMIMVKHFIKQTTIDFPAAGDKEITDLVAWETDHGYKVDITASQVAEVAKAYYGIATARVETNVTVDALKRELAAGRPVIIPAAGQLLGNPNFSGSGPPYHMLVLTGYDSSGFIANDPGTRRGHNYRYSYDTILNAIHDWTGSKSTITEGKKAYLVFD